MSHIFNSTVPNCSSYRECSKYYRTKVWGCFDKYTSYLQPFNSATFIHSKRATNNITEIAKLSRGKEERDTEWGAVQRIFACVAFRKSVFKDNSTQEQPVTNTTVKSVNIHLSWDIAASQKNKEHTCLFIIWKRNFAKSTLYCVNELYGVNCDSILIALAIGWI